MTISWLENERTQFPVGTSDGTSNRNVRKTLVPYTWIALLGAREKLMGTAGADAGLDGGLLKRRLPWKDPDDPTMYVVKVDHRGVGFRGADDSAVPDLPMTTANAFEFWELTCYFETLPYLVGDGAVDPGDPDTVIGVTPSDETTRYCTKLIRPGREYITPKEGDFRWDDGAGRRVNVPFPIPQILPFQEIDVTWWWVPINATPTAAVDVCGGRVNKFALDLPTVPVPAPLILPGGTSQYPAETLLLESVRLQECRFPRGERGNHVTYHLRYRPSGWNKFPGPDGVFRRVYRGNSNDGLFEATDFRFLFTPQTSAVPTP